MNKGFFNELIDIRNEYDENAGYEFLENASLDEDCYDLYQFLHGFCDEFAVLNARKNGYKVVLWTAFDEEIKKERLVHAFNQFEDGGKTYYSDIRGITDNLELIKEEFEDYEYENIKIFDNEVETINFIKQLLGCEKYILTKEDYLRSVFKTYNNIYKI